MDLPVAAHRLILWLVWRARRLRPSLTGQRSLDRSHWRSPYPSYMQNFWSAA
jgi:hypothetical protein